MKLPKSKRRQVVAVWGMLKNLGENGRFVEHNNWKGNGRHSLKSWATASAKLGPIFWASLWAKALEIVAQKEKKT